jgi:hypothetical protein
MTTTNNTETIYKEREGKKEEKGVIHHTSPAHF